MTVDPQTPGVPDHAKPAAKVERKVTMATLGAYLGGVVILAVVNAFTSNDNQLLLATLPDVVEPFLLPVVPAVVTFISGWASKHTPRPDLGQG
jgi:hypothetical protein